MKFPITREELQTFNREEYIINDRINKSVQQVCDRIKQQILYGSREKRFIVRDELPNRQQVGRDAIISMFMDRLKETFIECDITIDPLKTYIIIDWS